MFRNLPPPSDSPAETPRGAGAIDPRPMIIPSTRIDLPAARAVPLKHSMFNGPLRERLVAGGMHLALSATAGAVVLALVLLAWYPSPMPTLHGVDSILLMMLGVDVVLGPLFTLIVFDRRKKNLSLDLAAIAAVQVLALSYGLHTIQQGRPAFVVLVKDRFEVVAPSEIWTSAKQAAAGNPLAVPNLLGPRWVAARLPDSAAERNAILFESLEKGRDVQHHPKLYVEYASQAQAAVDRALPVSKLRELNPEQLTEIDAAVSRSGLAEADLRYLPLRGPARDGAVLVARSDARVLEVLSLRPW